MNLKKLDAGTSQFFIIDDLPPENLAMLQALYARSSKSVEVQLASLTEKKVGRFHENYVVKYNHKSIADGGSTTFFIENVSILVAKAFQNSSLYNGQETSTRAIDMTGRTIIDPFKTSLSKRILDRWMDFYFSSAKAVTEHVRATYPRGEGVDEGTYDAAVSYRSFDIRRGFLPAGMTTQLSWHSTLRHAGDHLSWLCKHPLEEVRRAAHVLREMAAEQYPSSGMDFDTAGLSGVPMTEGAAARAAWQTMVATDYAYPARQSDFPHGKYTFWSSICDDDLQPLETMFESRPRGAVLPHFVSDLGHVRLRAPIDYGSWRDIQRHRNGVCRAPMLTTFDGFEPWYLNSLSSELREEAIYLIRAQEAHLALLDRGAIAERQYLTPLGFRVPGDVTYGLDGAIYAMEIRASEVVHQTARHFVHKMAREFQKRFPRIALHVNMEEESWNLRRGSQTITERK